MNILASPDGINARAGDPTMPAVPFRYSPGAAAAGVRAQHNSDSRVVYLGFQFFDTGDPNRGAVMTRLLDWLDGDGEPTVDVLSPNGGEQFAQGTPVDIRWHATDVRVPRDAVDIYYTDHFPNSGWQLVASGAPNHRLFPFPIPNI